MFFYGADCATLLKMAQFVSTSAQRLGEMLSEVVDLVVNIGIAFIIFNQKR